MKILLSIFSFFLVLPIQCMEPSPSIPSKITQLTIEYAGATWQNYKHRCYQEDKIVYSQLQKGHFFGVYDGHGSDRTNNNVSSFLQEKLHRLFEQSKKETIKEKLEDAFYQAELYALANFIDGSTAVVAYIDEEYILHLAWTGDSRAVLEKNELVDYATTDHDIFNPSELKRIKEIGLSLYHYHICDKSRDHSLSVSRSIGDKRCKDITPEKPLGIGGFIAIPQYHAIQLTTENKFLIFATDGLWLDVKNKEAVQVTTTFQTNQDCISSPWPSWFKAETQDYITSNQCNESLQATVFELARGAFARESEDNIGILIAHLKWQKVQ